jgi:uncharacterized membrane protein YdjX (TVP38/TMEM64 family)
VNGDLLVVAGVVFAINLLPAFGPPTWAVLVFLRLNFDVAAVPLVIVGALSAAAGRYTLALGARAYRGRLSAERVASLEALREALERNRTGALAGLALFAVSPLPSAQLFMAAGITGVRLVPLTVAFFAGRVVSYSLYVGAASATEEALGPVLSRTLSSPWAVAVQILLLAGLVALVRVDWAKLLGRAPAQHGPGRGPA